MRWASRNLRALSFAALLAGAASAIVTPVLGVYALGVVGLSALVFGVIEGAAAAIAQLSRVFAGGWSERLGRRKASAILGFGISAGGAALLWFASGWAWVLGARGLDRLGAGVRIGAEGALLAESVTPERRSLVFRVHRLAERVGVVLGGLIALAIVIGVSKGLVPGAEASLAGESRAVLLAAAGLLALAAFACLFTDETPTSARGTRRAFTLRSLVAAWGEMPRKLRSLMGVSFCFGLSCASHQFLFLRAAEQGLKITAIIALYLVFALASFAGSAPARWLTDTRGRRNLLLSGYVVHAAAFLGFGMLHRVDSPKMQMLAFAGLFAFHGFYVGVTESVGKSLVADMAPMERRGEALALHAVALALAMLPASALFGLLTMEFGYDLAFDIGAAMSLVSACGLVWVMRR